MISKETLLEFPLPSNPALGEEMNRAIRLCNSWLETALYHSPMFDGDDIKEFARFYINAEYEARVHEILEHGRARLLKARNSYNFIK